MTARHCARLLPPFDATVIDVATCSRLEITIPLYEHEHAKHAMETWPDEVVRVARRQVEDWVARNGERAIVALTTAVTAKRVCVLIVHHDAKLAKEAPAPGVTSGPLGVAPGCTGELFTPPAAPSCITCAE